MSWRTVVANETRNVMYVRKHGKKYQYLVRLKGVSVSQSFWSKTDARLRGQSSLSLAGTQGDHAYGFGVLG